MRILSIFVLTLGIIAHSSKVTAQVTLSVLEKTVERIHSVPNITHDAFKANLSSPDSGMFVIFDTRNQEEYETSHIRKAVRLDPEISPEEFKEEYANTLGGKHLVFYCSVGYRSSASLKRLRDVALESGAISLVNLRGGIFRWYNEDNTVVNKDGVTDEIHPYSSVWSFLIRERKRE